METRFALFREGEEWATGSLGSGTADFYAWSGGSEAISASFFAQGTPVLEPSPGVLLLVAAAAAVSRIRAPRAR